jgi:hypothetical protein
MDINLFCDYKRKLQRDKLEQQKNLENMPKPCDRKAVKIFMNELNTFAYELSTKIIALDNKNDATFSIKQEALQDIINVIQEEKLNLYLLTLKHDDEGNLINEFRRPIVTAIANIFIAVIDGKKKINDDWWFHKYISEPVSNFCKKVAKFFNIGAIFSTRKVMCDLTENLTEKCNIFCR